MKNSLKNQIIILILCLLFPIITNAAISTNTNPTNDRKLVVENKNKTTELEKRTFKIGDEIHYSLVNDNRKQRGTITGFEADKILIKNKSGMEMSIPLNGLEEIQKPNKVSKTVDRLQNAIIVTGLGLISSMILVASDDEPKTSHPLSLPSETAILGLLGLLIFFASFSILSLIYLVSKMNLNYNKFSRRKGWKMKIE